MTELPLEPETKCYAWGSAIDRRIEKLPKRIDVSSSTPIVQIYAGTKQVCVAISSSGDVYSWGKGNIGRHCPNSSTRNIPSQMKGVRKIESVSLGEDHSLLRDREGNVYSFGDPPDGIEICVHTSKGHGKFVPRKMALKGKCKAVACGQSTCTLLMLKENNEHEVIMFGSHGSRILLQKRRRSNKVSPICLLRTPSQVTCLSSGANHVLAIINKTVFGWGSTENGRLGIGKEDSPSIIVEPIEISWFRVSNIFVNDIASGSAHSIILSEEGDMYTFGWNLYYQCGGTHTEDLFEPSFLKHCHGPIESIHAGFGHSAAVTTSGRLLCWGFNEEGQCGVGNERNVCNPTVVEFKDDGARIVISVALGSTHTVAVVSSCTKSEYLRRRSLIDKIKRAVIVLHRFARRILMRLRLRLFKKRDTLESCQHDDEVQDNEEDHHIGVEELEDSESSNSDVPFCDNTQVQDVQINSTSHISEIFAMQEEDEQSHLFRETYIRERAEKIRAKERMRQEIQRRFHIACMCKEDKLCLRWRAERKHQIKETRRVKQEAEQQKRLEVSRNRFQDGSNSKFLIAKKETKPEKSLIRTVTRRKVTICHRNKIDLPDKSIKDEKPTNMHSVANLHKKRNEILLRKREARLKKERKAIQEEKIKMEAEQEEKQRRQQFEKEQERMRIIQSIERLETDLHKRKETTTKILSQMNNHSNRLVPVVSDPFDLKPLRTVDEWSKELETVDNISFS